MKELSLVEKAFFLKKHPLFKELDLELLLTISDKMIQDVYDANENVFAENQEANRMYLIVFGQVKIYHTKSSKQCMLNANDYFAEESLFNERAREYGAICTQDTVFLTLSKTSLMTIISECPSIAIALLEEYTKLISCRHIFNLS